MMSDILEVYGYAADDTSDCGQKRWRSKKCPFIGERCMKKGGVCSVEASGEFMVCPQRLRGDDTIIHGVCEDAFPGMKLVRRDSRKYVSLPDTGIVVSAEQVKLGHGVADSVLLCLKGGGRIEIASIEIQTMDITGTYRCQLQAYKRCTRDGEGIDVPSSKHWVNVANVRKRLVDQLLRKARMFEQLGDCYRGMYFVTLEPVWSHFESVLGCMNPIPAGFSGTALTVMTYRLGAAVGSGRKRGIVHCSTTKFDLEEFASRVAAGGVLPSRCELIEQIGDATGKSLGNVATKRAARRAVTNYLGSEMADHLYKKPAQKRRVGRGGKVKATCVKRSKARRGGAKKARRPG